MEFNLEAISSALDEILDYHKDIEQLDTFSSRSRSASQYDTRAARSNTSTDRRAADAKHLNDSRWGQDPIDTAPAVQRQTTPVQRRQGHSGSISTQTTPSLTGAIVNAEPRQSSGAVHGGGAGGNGVSPADARHDAQPISGVLAPRPRNRDAASSTLISNGVQKRSNDASPQFVSPKHTPTVTTRSAVVANPQPAARRMTDDATDTLLPADLVSASGLGAAAALVHRPEDSPRKPWVTYYAKNAAPYVVLRCAPLAHPASRVVQDSAATARQPGVRVEHVRDLVVTVQLQLTVAELESLGMLESWGTISLACSHDAQRGFIRVADVSVSLDTAYYPSTEASPKGVSSAILSPTQQMGSVLCVVTVPGLLLAPFIKCTLTPWPESVRVTHACRVSRVSLEWAETWSERRVTTPALQPPSLRDEMDALTSSSAAKREQEECLSEAEAKDDRHHNIDDSISTVDDEQEGAVEDVHPFSTAESYAPSDAREHRDTAIATPPRSASSSSSPPTTTTSASRSRMQTESYYYDWRHDGFYDGSPSTAAGAERHVKPSGATGVASAASSWQRAADDEVKRTGEQDGPALALEAWDASPLWSLAQSLAFGQHQAAFFSVAIAHAQEVQRRMGLLSLSALPFAFHICALRFRRGETMSSLQWIVALSDDLARDGFRLELACRVLGGGFLGAIRDGGQSLDDACPRWVLVLPCTTNDDVAALLHKCYATATRAPPDLPELTSIDGEGGHTASAEDRCCLRILLDWTRSFESLLPVLRTWSTASPSIQYYGARHQAPLCHFVTPRRPSSSSAPDRDTTTDTLTQLAPILWSGVTLSGEEVMVSVREVQTVSAAFSSSSSSYSARKMPLLSLSVTRQQPFFLVWKSRAAPSAPRVVLTDQHILQSMGCVHGALVPPAVQSLAASLFTDADGLSQHKAEPSVEASRFLARLVVVNEAPWQSLRQAVDAHGTSLERRSVNRSWRHASEAAQALHSRDSAALAAEVARTTQAWVFHALTTAFRREWDVVGLCLPECAVLPIDEDAFMDTILHWDYPFPRTVVVFHPAALARSGAHDEGDDACGGTVRTCFSQAGLAHFASTTTLEEGVA